LGSHVQLAFRVLATTMAVPHRGKPSTQHWLTGAYALHLVRLVSRWRVSPAELLDGLGVSEADLAEPGSTLSLESVVVLCERARALTGEPGLGFHLGLSQHATSYGFTGFAGMSCETLGQAIELSIRFAPLSTTMVSLRLEVQRDVASLVVVEHSDPGSARDLLLISLLVGLQRMGQEITAGRLNDSIDLSIPEPDYCAKFAKLAPKIRFGQPVNRTVFAASSLALPLVMADPAALRLARDQCERALEALGSEAVLVARVRRAIVGRPGFRSMRQVAAELRLSPRQLTRSLAPLRTSFVALVDEERQKKALRLLAESHCVLEDVAEQLGYSTLSNFVRAFHRWTGQTPAAYRRNTQQGAALKVVRVRGRN
jgi:AraC-like DNA-binding protein